MKRIKEGSKGKEQGEESKAESCLQSVSKMEKSTVSRPRGGAAPSSGRDRSYSSSRRRDWKRELENDRPVQKQREGKRSPERRKEGENHRDRGEERSKSNSRGDQGSLPVPKDKTAGDHQSPPPLLPHDGSEEKGPLASEGTKNRREKDGERPSSSSACRDSSRKEWTRERRQKKEKGETPHEQLDEREDQKKSRKGRDGRGY